MDGRLFFFGVPIYYNNASWPVPQGEGERVVMDLQDIGATLEDRVAQSNIRLFLTADPQNDEEDTIPVTMMKVSVPRITKARKMTLMSEVFMELEENFSKPVW